MGGDNGPGPLVAGALRAAAAGLDIILVGDRVELERLVAESPRPAGEDIAATGSGTIDVVHTDDSVGMDEDPALAVRAKPNASVRLIMRLLADGTAQAAVSAGSTGATMAAALLGLGRLGRIRRPAIAGALPVAGPSGSDVLLVDAGGSPDVQPPALVDWARLGAAYARARTSAAPRIGLLNVGTEEGKGNELTRAASVLLQSWAEGLPSSSAFVGNVEPADVLAGRVDVVVTDGFTGNIVIKTLEAAFADRIEAPPGAVLVGVDGTVVVAHGAAGPIEIAGALSTAAAVAGSGWLERVRSELA